MNVFGAIALIKGVLPFMRKRRSKFALEVMSEAIAKEVKHLGIKVTALAPGGFRTDWAGRSMVRAARKISDYDALFDPVRKARQEKHGNQVGDPNKAAKALLSLVRAKLDELTTGIDKYETLTKSTDGPK